MESKSAKLQGGGRRETEDGRKETGERGREIGTVRRKKGDR